MNRIASNRFNGVHSRKLNQLHCCLVGCGSDSQEFNTLKHSKTTQKEFFFTESRALNIHAVLSKLRTILARELKDAEFYSQAVLANKVLFISGFDLHWLNVTCS